MSRDAWAQDGFAPVPGDVLAFADSRRATVATVYLCAESSGDVVTRWTWAVLEDGCLLEVAPRGCALYEPPVLLARGSVPFLALVAQDGALVRFEDRVRAGTWTARPVRLTLERRRWRLTATGTVTAQRLGPVPENGWGQLGARAARLAHPTNGRPALQVPVPPHAGEEGSGWGTPATQPTHAAAQPAVEPDVYFTLAESGGAGGMGIGLWATDVCLAFGRRLGDTPAAAGLVVVSEDRTDAPTDAR